MQKYAIHNAQTAFSFRRFDENVPDVRTSGGSGCSTTNAIRVIYGNELAKNLLPELKISDPKLAFHCRCLCSTADYTGKRNIFLLFVNNRLVDCPNLKKAIEQIYSVYLPKNSQPFCYLALDIAPQNLDVNVHPTKQLVHFLFEDEIIDMIKKSIDNALASTNCSRTFKIDTFSVPKLLTHDKEGSLEESFSKANKSSRRSSTALNSSNLNSSTAQHSIVRVDASQQKLHRFFGSTPSSSSTVVKPPSLDSFSFGRKSEPKIVKKTIEPSESVDNDEEILATNDERLMEVDEGHGKNDKKTKAPSPIKKMAVDEEKIDEEQAQESIPSENIERSVEMIKPVAMKRKKPMESEENEEEISVRIEKLPSTNGSLSKMSFSRRDVQLDSVKKLRETCEGDLNESLARVCANFNFVGCIDSKRSLIQHDGKLLMANNELLFCDFFYQEILHNFGNLGFIRFEGEFFFSISKKK